jgi:hypothetical protein
MNRLAHWSAQAQFRFRSRLLHCGLLLFAALCSWPSTARAISPDSPEVKSTIEKGLKYLDTAADGRLGAQALVGLCYIKHGEDESNPQVQKAVDACKATTRGGGGLQGNPDIYSTGLAIVFLCELNPSKYQHEINALLKSLQARQKKNGGWGYPDKPTGDTSMTQYGVLASWEAKKNGFVVPNESIESVCLWLIHTQDPSGGWGYQGTEGQPGTSGDIVLVKQDSVRHGLSAAGLGATYVCSDLLGFTLATEEESDAGLPAALKAVREDVNKVKLNQPVPAGMVGPRQLAQTQERGRGWWREHYKIDTPTFPYYYLYALERSQSFYELIAGLHIKNPGWYDDGYNWLHKRQKLDGHWESTQDMKVPDTAFAILFLLRSTKKSIEKSKGFDGGLALGGQGLPRHLNEVRADGGRVVAKPVAGSTDTLLAILANPDHADFRDLADDPRDLIAQLQAEEPAPRAEHLARLRHLAAEGTAATRLAAVRVLSSVRDIANAPALIAALSDADWRIVYKADQGLRLFSRRIGPDLLTEAPDEQARAAAIADWKRWYASISPSDDAAPPRRAAEGGPRRTGG